MSDKPRQPVLRLLACGENPADELEPFIKSCQELGWDVHIVTIHPALAFPAKEALAELTGHPVCDDQLEPLHPLPTPGALAVAPACFDVINKWAYGNNDSLALRLLNEATGLGLPVLVVPHLEPAFARHPAFLESLDRLRGWGITIVFDPTRLPPPDAHPDDHSADPLAWQVAERVIAEWTRFARLPAPGTGIDEDRPQPTSVDYGLDPQPYGQGAYHHGRDDRQRDLALLTPPMMPVAPALPATT